MCVEGWLQQHHARTRSARAQKRDCSRSEVVEQSRDWLQQLATALEVSKSRLYKDLVFAREYIGKEVEQLEARGFLWKHVETAQRLPDKKA